MAIAIEAIRQATSTTIVANHRGGSCRRTAGW
ncbi:MAG: hypothetical protein QOG26_209 [Solirubrobacterales bacterium]|jgi:hypothetical protein|nr:hypothetical protein [Solirubrobacterales bacterium]